MGAIYRNGVPYTGVTIASEISYDNTISGINADNVQDAIDRINVTPGGGGTASSVTYNNTVSGLLATNVQDAIDELNDAGASTISYSNASSGISATNVQDAIDETVSTIFDYVTTTVFTVLSSGWGSSVTIDGTSYYPYTINLTAAYLDRPIVSIEATGTLPTTAEQTAYDSWQYVTVDKENLVLTLYAKTVPVSDFKIAVKGVE